MRNAVGAVICDVDEDGDPVLCTNRKYMGGKFVAMRQMCDDCPHESEDLFTGIQGFNFWGFYCTFRPAK